MGYGGRGMGDGVWGRGVSRNDSVLMRCPGEFAVVTSPFLRMLFFRRPLSFPDPAKRTQGSAFRDTDHRPGKATQSRPVIRTLAPPLNPALCTLHSEHTTPPRRCGTEALSIVTCSAESIQLLLSHRFARSVRGFLQPRRGVEGALRGEPGGEPRARHKRPEGCR